MLLLLRRAFMQQGNANARLWIPQRAHYKTETTAACELHSSEGILGEKAKISKSEVESARLTISEEGWKVNTATVTLATKIKLFNFLKFGRKIMSVVAELDVWRVSDSLLHKLKNKTNYAVLDRMRYDTMSWCTWNGSLQLGLGQNAGPHHCILLARWRRFRQNTARPERIPELAYVCWHLAEDRG